MNQRARVWVGGLDPQTTEEDLRELFAAYNPTYIQMPQPKNGKVFAFVQFDNDDDALDAIDGLQGAVLRGCNIIINEAYDRKSEKSSDGCHNCRYKSAFLDIQDICSEATRPARARRY